MPRPRATPHMRQAGPGDRPLRMRREDRLEGPAKGWPAQPAEVPPVGPRPLRGAWLAAGPGRAWCTLIGTTCTAWA